MEKKRNTIIERAKAQIDGFADMYALLEQKVVLGGLSESTLSNYGRCIARIAMYFHQVPTSLEEEQINGYLYDLKTNDKPSLSYFKHTVYGLRFLYRMYDLSDKAIKLPSLKRDNKLPVILSKSECKRLFRNGKILKHRVLLSLIYSCGLRQKELRSLHQSDVDFDRMEVHIRKTKYNKSRYVPLSPLMARGLKKYFEAYKPVKWVFNGKGVGHPLSARGVQWAMKEAVKAAGIKKEATIHTLRHSYATHLLESGMDVDTLRVLPGHAHLTSTMVYLHVARLKGSNRYSPFDLLYKKDES
jgi:site-specific recombinase XerD